MKKEEEGDKGGREGQYKNVIKKKEERIRWRGMTVGERDSGGGLTGIKTGGGVWREGGAAVPNRRVK